MREQMLEQATKAMHNAYAPYSNFHVGCCIRATDGKLYNGCNIEVANYSLTLCAEASAVAAMISSGSKKIAELVVVVDDEKIATSCGSCRQRLYEFAESPDVKAHFFNNKGESKTLTIGEMLPDPFVPHKDYAIDNKA